MSDKKATIELPFAIGESVWRVSLSPKEKRRECPECAGKKEVTLVLGNGDFVAMPCETCKPAWESPRGYIIDKDWSAHTPLPFVCRSFRVDQDGTVRYSESEPGAGCYSIVDANDLFRDYDECAAKCAELAAEAKTRLDEQNTNSIARHRKNMLVSYAFWKRKIRELERELELARARFSACKAPKRTKKGEESHE